MSGRGIKGKKKTTFNPAIPPFIGTAGSSSSAAEATPSSSTASASKRPRSNTSTSLRDFTPETDPLKYWGKRFVEEKKKRGDVLNFDSIVYIFLEINSEIQKDYTKKCDLEWEQNIQIAEYQQSCTSAVKDMGSHINDTLSTIRDVNHTSQIQALADMVEDLQTKHTELEQLILQTPVAPPKASGSTPELTPPPPPPPPPTPPPVQILKPSWAQVVRKPRNKTTPPSAKPAVAEAPPSPPTPKAPSTKKGLTLRERRLIIKRDGSSLTTSTIAIRDSINTALQATLIQRIERNPANDLLFTTMDTVRATSLNSKISQFLHLVPGTTTVHLDSPTAQVLVHNIPTAYSLADICKEFTTYNTGLVLAQQPRWLRTEET